MKTLSDAILDVPGLLKDGTTRTEMSSEDLSIYFIALEEAMNKHAERHPMYRYIGHISVSSKCTVLVSWALKYNHVADP